MDARFDLTKNPTAQKVKFLPTVSTRAFGRVERELSDP